MLNWYESEYIKEYIRSSDHDYFFWSGLLGEPFLYQDILYYFDGETVSIAGFPINARLDRLSVLDRLRNVVLTWLEVPSVCFFNYFGPWSLDLDTIVKDKFSVMFSLEPRMYNVDMFIELSHSEALKTRNARESIRKANCRGLTVQKVQRSFLRYEHIDLIRILASRSSVWLSDVSYLTNIVQVLRDRVTTFFEVEINQRLVGFGVAHEFFEQRPFLVLSCFDNTCKGVSDAIYAAVISHYKERGAKWLGLGYSVDEGLYKYKMKWGGVQCNPPFYQCIWMKHGIKTTSVDCLHWICRLLVKKSQEPSR